MFSVNFQETIKLKIDEPFPGIDTIYDNFTAQGRNLKSYEAEINCIKTD